MKSECSYSGSVAMNMDDLKRYSKSLIEDFKVEGEKMLARIKEDLKKFAARNSTKKRKRNKAKRILKTGQAQKQKSTQSELQLEEHMSDSSSRNCILPVNYLRAGSAMDAVDVVSDDLEINLDAEEERNELVSIDNDGENEKEIKDAELEDFSTIKDAELEDFSTVDGLRKSRRNVKEPAWMKDCIMPLNYVNAGPAMDAVALVSDDLEIYLEAEQEMNELVSLDNEVKNEKEIEDAQVEALLTLDGPRKSGRNVKEPAWMKDFMTV